MISMVKAEQQVQRTNVFVVGGIDPTAPTVMGAMVVVVSWSCTVAMGMKNCAHIDFL
jgi:hypothetical protein